MTVRMISLGFDEISSGLPDVHHIIIQNRIIIQNHIIKKPFFIFAPETFLGHLGVVGRSPACEKHVFSRFTTVGVSSSLYWSTVCII